MTDFGEEMTAPKLKLIKKGVKPQRVVEVGSIGEYKPNHPSARRQLIEDSAKIIKFDKK